MPKKDESDAELAEIFDGLCAKLDVDAATAKKSKDSFFEIKRNYTLDGDYQHWMSCALYVACRSTITPTIESGKALEGNCVSLTKLLRLCNISLIQFFTKIKNWMEMASMPTEFKERISLLEQKFAVSTVLFRKFQPIFQELFIGLTSEPLKTVNNMKSKKHKLQPCTTNALFEFTWCLYICVKGEFNNSTDLVDMYHLLLSCLDYVYGNAYIAHRVDLINPSFKGLLKEWQNEDFEIPSKPPCIISTLCEIIQGLSVEATTMKVYNWQPVIKSFFEKDILKGDADTLLGVLDVGKFDTNLKSLNNLYETYVLSVGEFDERIFLGEHANDQVEARKVSGEEISQVIATFGPSARACPDTPLTGRRYLSGRDALSPVSAAANCRAHLHALLRAARPAPSPALRMLLLESGADVSLLAERAGGWAARLAGAVRDPGRAELVSCLYFRVLEHIIREEHRKKPQVSLKMLISQETYQLAIYACCTEIVIHAYGFHSLRFPKVLQLFGLSAFHFYKVIELVVQAVFKQLSRDVIKHLNAVEEEVLESLVWRAESPLWERLARAPVPASSDVAAPESPRRPPVEQARKQLFTDHIRPGQSLLAANHEPAEPQEPAAPKKPNNSLVLFFRKFYGLAVVRMNDLCSYLQLTDEELKRKIWTCVEYSVMRQTQLLRDRHLDQLLMCAVYVICKVSHHCAAPVERTFTEIMRCYRQLPLADSHVYRSVLIAPDERGDLIKFYNKVYVQCMQTFALRFTGKNKEECGLSPLPAGRGADGRSPAGARVSERLRLYVKPLTEPEPQLHHLTYRFSRSPAKDLHAINTMVSLEGAWLKRSAEAEAGVVKRARLPGAGVARKLHGLVTDRQRDTCQLVPSLDAREK